MTWYIKTNMAETVVLVGMFAMLAILVGVLIYQAPKQHKSLGDDPDGPPMYTMLRELEGYSAQRAGGGVHPGGGGRLPVHPGGMPLHPIGPGGMPLHPIGPGGIPIHPIGPGRVPMHPIGPGRRPYHPIGPGHHHGRYPLYFDFEIDLPYYNGLCEDSAMSKYWKCRSLTGSPVCDRMLSNDLMSC